jgi:hypothetical protein
MPSQIFDVTEVFDLYQTVGQGIFSTIFRAAVDFIAQDNKEWYYYAGVALGATAAATGIAGASAAVVVTANSVELLLQKGPNAAKVRIFLDGVEQGVIDLEAVSEVWELFEVVIDPVTAAKRRLELIVDDDNNPGLWMAIGGLTAYRIDGDPVVESRNTTMAYNTIAFRLKDAESDTTEATVPIYVPTGLTIAQYQTYIDAVAPEIDLLTESQIVSVSITLSMTLPGGIKGAPIAGALNERGGLITFDTTGPRADSVRIPAMDRSKMPGDSFSLQDTDVAAFITRLTTSTTAGAVRPRTSQDYQFSAARKGAKSFRK